MNGLLDKAIDKLRALPVAEQDAVAAMILEKLADKQSRYEPRNRLRIRPEPPEPLEVSEGKDWEATPENAERISAHIKALVEAGCVPEARGIVSEIRPGVSEELDYWKKVLALPVARKAGPGSGGDMRKDMIWLDNNSHKYRGRWVALRSGVLLGSHKSRAELRRMMRQAGKLDRSFFIYIGNGGL